MGEESESRGGVSWMQVAASALAAVSSAVLLSTLGVAGTLIGAALGSVVATIGTSLYTRTLDVSRQQVAAQAAALRRVTVARSELDEVVAARQRGEAVSASRVTRAGRELDEAEEVLAAAPSDPDAAHPQGDPDPVDGDRGRDDGPVGSRVPPRTSLAQVFSAGWPAQLSWRRLALLAGAVFLVAMAAITAFELTTGQAVSVYTGGSDRQTGSTVPGLGRAGDRTPSETPKPGDPTAEPTGSPSDTATEEPTEPVDPTAEPSDVPSEVPTPSPTLTPTPSPSPDVPSSDPSATASG